MLGYSHKKSQNCIKSDRNQGDNETEDVLDVQSSSLMILALPSMSFLWRTNRRWEDE